VKEIKQRNLSEFRSEKACMLCGGAITTGYTGNLCEGCFEGSSAMPVEFRDKAERNKEYGRGTEEFRA
jgi:hypothetical protein